MGEPVPESSGVFKKPDEPTSLRRKRFRRTPAGGFSNQHSMKSSATATCHLESESESESEFELQEIPSSPPHSPHRETQEIRLSTLAPARGSRPSPAKKSRVTASLVSEEDWESYLESDSDYTPS